MGNNLLNPGSVFLAPLRHFGKGVSVKISLLLTILNANRVPFVPASAQVKGHQAVDPLSILLGSVPVQSTEVCKRGLQMEPSEVTAAL